MAQVSSYVEDPNDVVVTSHSLTAETITSPPPLPTLPFDVLPEILCRLPVKLLVQLRCLCKFFNSLISDPNFAKKHLQFSTKRHHLILVSHDYFYFELVLHDYPIPSVFSTSTVVTQTQLDPPITLTYRPNYVSAMRSCDGIFCCELNIGSYFLWNPSIRKFKLLPPLPLENLCTGAHFSHFSTSFGYDRFIDNYKVIVSKNNEVYIYTLGTDYWRRIEDFPYDIIYGLGIFVSGTVNWVADDMSSWYSRFILSLDLEKELYQKLLLPNIENKDDSWGLGVVRDCLCVFADTDMFWGVWIMKEYGNEKSWTKLYTIPIHTMQDRGLEPLDALYISEDDQLLVECFEIEGNNMNLIVYDSKTGTLNFQNNYYQRNPQIYIESLISP